MQKHYIICIEAKNKHEKYYKAVLLFPEFATVEGVFHVVLRLSQDGYCCVPYEVSLQVLIFSKTGKANCKECARSFNERGGKICKHHERFSKNGAAHCCE